MITIGLNFSSHDSAAAIAVDGKLIHAVAEERLTRNKHDGSFPVRSINACLSAAGARIEDVDHVTLGWPRPIEGHLFDYYSSLTRKTPSVGLGIVPDILRRLHRSYTMDSRRLMRRNSLVPRQGLNYMGHHHAHAVSAYACSEFDDAAVLVMDGRGTWEATTVWSGRDGKLELLHSYSWPNSLGLFYAAFTSYLGFEPFADEWKVMGLAPYGGAGVDLGEFLTIQPDGYTVMAKPLLGYLAGQGEGRLAAVLGPVRRADDPITDHHRDVAWAVQDLCERAEEAVVRHAMTLAKSRNLCIAGGVGLNCKANGRLISKGLVRGIFVQPAASDDGVAIGAALMPQTDSAGRLPRLGMMSASLGGASEQSTIEKSLGIWKIPFEVVDDPAETTARLLADGMLVGWFQGREEFGPRALGHRSILADPRDAGARDRVNNAVKFREEWRPFAPSIAEEEAREFFEDYCPSPFMTLSFKVRPAMRNRIQAAVHVDGTARVQTVTPQSNPVYYRLLKQVGRHTGTSCVLNTSFNLKGEPIVSSPYDAIRTFYTSGLDVLVLERCVIHKMPRERNRS